MSGKRESRKSERTVDDEEPVVQAFFPEIFNLSSLKIDTSLPLIQFSGFKDIIETRNFEIDLGVVLLQKKLSDIYLYVNNVKRDMFYQVSSGIYNFKSIKLKEGKNIVEFFYRVGKKRSSSVYSTILKN